MVRSFHVNDASQITGFSRVSLYHNSRIPFFIYRISSRDNYILLPPAYCQQLHDDSDVLIFLAFFSPSP
jgi:hypothetical protein